jgi:endonuclease IV
MSSLKQVTQDLRQIVRECNHDNTDGNETGIQQILEELEEIILEMEQTNRLLPQP